MPGWLGNLGGIERGDQQSHVEIREAIEKLARKLDQLANHVTAKTTQNVIYITNPNPPTVENFPYTVSLSYPFVVLASAQLFPDGLDLLNGVAYKVVYAEMVCDPDAQPPTANTTFTIQNAATSPTSTGTVTFTTGSRRASSATIVVNVAAGQRLYIQAPSALNSLQTPYSIRLMLNRP